jgi:4-amino-4-deoxy-L-arabinose transferase-like glycosyltransferase
MSNAKSEENMLNDSISVRLWNSAQSVLVGRRLSQVAVGQVSAPTRLQIMLWGVVVAIAAFIFIAKYGEFQIGAHFQDDATYVVLAKSLLYSDRYGLINGPGGVEPTHYPIGFPLLLAPIIYVLPHNLDALRVIALLTTLLNTALLFWAWRSFSRLRSYWWALAIVVLYALSPLIVDHTRMVMSEPPFLACCLVAFVLAEQLVNRRQVFGWHLWMSIALVLAFLIRTVGITLLFTVLAYLLWRNGRTFWKSLVLILVLMTLIVGAILWLTPATFRDLVPTGYVSQIASSASSEANLIETVSPQDRLTWYGGVLLRQVLLPLGGGLTEKNLLNSIGLAPQPFVSGLLLTALVFVGFVTWMYQEGISSFNLFPAVYLGVIYFWEWEGIRFLYPIEPQLQMAFLIAIEAVLVGLAGRWRTLNASRLPRAVFVAVVVVLVLGNLYKSARIESSLMHVGDVYARTAWLKANTLPTDLVMTEEPIVDYVNGERRTVPFRDKYASASEFAQDLREKQTQYVLLAPGLWWQARYKPGYSEHLQLVIPLVNELAAAHQLELVYSEPGNLIQVFKVQP